ncbi:MAG: hypothetical protein U0O22_05280, partial [Acutalibacteraceae bacterium]
MARFKTSQKVISMILTVLMLMSTVMVGGTFTASAADVAQTETIYFVPSANWKDAGARFAAYFFDGNGKETWVSLTKGTDDMYAGEYDATYTNVIFVRMNPNTQDNNWETTNKWNQTADLKISGNCFKLTSTDWDNGNGEWSTIGAPTTDPVTAPVTNPVTDPVTDPVTNPVSKNAIYFVPSKNWTDAGARFSAYLFGGNAEATWVSLTATTDGKYTAEMPAGYTSVIFVRMNPNTTDNNWETV